MSAIISIAEEENSRVRTKKAESVSVLVCAVTEVMSGLSYLIESEALGEAV